MTGAAVERHLIEKRGEPVHKRNGKPKGPERFIPEILRAVDLYELDLKDPLFVVAEILPEGLTIFGGKPKQGKSWLALWTAISVAFGQRALGTLDTKKGRVLYLALEDSPRRIKKRLRVLLGENYPPPNLDISTRWAHTDQGGIEDLKSYLKDHPDTVLIIIDTLEKLRPAPKGGGGGSSYGDDYRYLSSVKEIADESGVAILMVHHLRKSEAADPFERISGTYGINGCADTLWVLDRKRGSEDGELHVAGRDVEENEFALSFDKAKWEIIGDAEEYRLSGNRRQIIDLLRGGDEFTVKEIADQVDGLHYNSVSRLLNKMEAEGHVLRAERGRYKKNIGGVIG